ncbi:MAG: alternative ribosome rescue aminoacyl-tRNA hydrolase ArfB [Phycisphaerales bacterium JB038]
MHDERREGESPQRGESEVVEAAPGVVLPKAILRFSFARSAGPGGQHVNKVNTAVTLRVHLADLRQHARLNERAMSRLRELAGGRLTKEDELLLRCQASRSQWSNRQTAIERLGALVLEARSLPKPRKKTRPSRGAKERRLQQKRQQREKKQRRNWRPED